MKWSTSLGMCKKCGSLYMPPSKDDISLCNKCVNTVFKEMIRKEIKKMGYPV